MSMCNWDQVRGILRPSCPSAAKAYMSQLVRFATLFTLTEDHCGGSGMSPFRSTNHTDGLDRDLADGTSNLANDGKYHQPQGWSWLTKRRKQ